MDLLLSIKDLRDAWKILSGPCLNQPKKPRLKGEGAPGLGEEGRSCLGFCLHGILTHTHTTCAVTGAGKYFQLHFHLTLFQTHGDMGLG